MKTLFLVASFTCVIAVANAQSMQPIVIGSAGTYASSASGSMSWTIGELMTETYSSAGNFFTQGFHQPDTSAALSVENISVENISIYPNPVLDNLMIDFADAHGNYFIHIYDMQGQLLRSENISAHQQQLKISFREFADGIYLLNIINTASNTINSYKINKTK